jgi:hypothetical protein
MRIVNLHSTPQLSLGHARVIRPALSYIDFVNYYTGGGAIVQRYLPSGKDEPGIAFRRALLSIIADRVAFVVLVVKGCLQIVDPGLHATSRNACDSLEHAALDGGFGSPSSNLSILY